MGEKRNTKKMQTIGTIKEKVTSTVKPVIESAITRGTDAATAAVEGAIALHERIDPEARQREAYFTTSEAAEGEEEVKRAPQVAVAATSQQDSQAVVEQTDDANSSDAF